MSWTGLNGLGWAGRHISIYRTYISKKAQFGVYTRVVVIQIGEIDEGEREGP